MRMEGQQPGSEAVEEVEEEDLGNGMVIILESDGCGEARLDDQMVSTLGGDGAASDDEDDGMTIMWGGGEELDSLCGCECIPEGVVNALHAMWWCFGEVAEALLGHFVC